MGLFCSSGIQGAKPSRAVLPSTAGAAWWLWALGAFSDLRPLGSSPPPLQQLLAPLGSASLVVTSLASGGGRVGGPSRRPPAIRQAQPHHCAPPLRPPLRARLFRARAGPRLFWLSGLRARRCGSLFFPLVAEARPSLQGCSRASGHASSSPGASFPERPGPSGGLVVSEAAPSVSDPRLGRMRLLRPYPGEPPIPVGSRDPHLSRLEGGGGGGARLSGRSRWLVERTTVTMSSLDALWDPLEPYLGFPCIPLYPESPENSSSRGYQALPRLS